MEAVEIVICGEPKCNEIAVPNYANKNWRIADKKTKKLKVEYICKNGHKSILTKDIQGKGK